MVGGSLQHEELTIRGSQRWECREHESMRNTPFGSSQLYAIATYLRLYHVDEAWPQLTLSLYLMGGMKGKQKSPRERRGMWEPTASEHSICLNYQ